MNKEYFRDKRNEERGGTGNSRRRKRVRNNTDRKWEQSAEEKKYARAKPDKTFLRLLEMGALPICRRKKDLYQLRRNQASIFWYKKNIPPPCSRPKLTFSPSLRYNDLNSSRVPHFPPFFTEFTILPFFIFFLFLLSLTHLLPFSHSFFVLHPPNDINWYSFPMWSFTDKWTQRQIKWNMSKTHYEPQRKTGYCVDEWSNINERIARIYCTAK